MEKFELYSEDILSDVTDLESKIKVVEAELGEWADLAKSYGQVGPELSKKKKSCAKRKVKFNVELARVKECKEGGEVGEYSYGLVKTERGEADTIKKEKAYLESKESSELERRRFMTRFPRKDKSTLNAEQKSAVHHGTARKELAIDGEIGRASCRERV